MDYRSTLNLPSTPFPMRANLPKREPEILKEWEESAIYHKIRSAREAKSAFVLHDGPPYANGAIHLGTGLNKILKDMINKSKLLLGKNIHYRPGWDCHGLPIELNVTKNLSEEEKESIDTIELRRRCRNFALKFVDKHRKSFKRLGVIGDWERPYLTLSTEYEGEELRQFAALVRNGYVYQGMKPIYWCPSCVTALAEAEVEYEEHTSPSIYVRFALTEESKKQLIAQAPEIDGRPIHVVIWTTTPWTLPANRAVCLHPNFVYTLVPTPNEYLLIAKDLSERFISETNIKKAGNLIGSFTGKELEDLKIHIKPPLDELEVPLICGRHVTLEQGTGAVHTAPGHGHEDYLAALDYNLEIFAPVDKHGCFTDASPVCHGMKVDEANPVIIKMLHDKGLLIHKENYLHSYPFCWRCKKPIVFRATRQWFTSLEKDDLRDRLLQAIDEVAWIPSWGRQRIRSMVENRQEWCISRQRAWGVPIPAFYIGESEEGILDADFIDELAEIVSKKGTNFWFHAMEDPSLLEQFTTLKRLLPEGAQLTDVRLEKDILDVWFDSGVSHHSVMALEENIYPVDMYLEGSDQHRGWFQSSLVTAVGAGKVPPYKAVLTHGFTVDEKGRKLSKSLGNFVVLDDLIKQTGADVIRLWVAAEDFRGDMTFSNEILSRITESYRRMRNTVRFLLGNIYDFSPSESVPESERLSLDQWILNRWRQCKKRIIKAFNHYDFHRVFYDLNNFCSVDLSALYLDIAKDRLYVSQKDGLERKSCQSSLVEIAIELTAVVAPILSFTGEEIWTQLRELGLTSEESVFLYELNQKIPPIDEELMERWDKIFMARGEIVKAIELLRKEGSIGHSLDCSVTVEPPDEKWRTLFDEAIQAKRGDHPLSIFIVSEFQTGSIQNGDNVYESSLVPGMKIHVSKAPGNKCPRCWHFDKTVSENGDEVCPRCNDVIG